VSSWIEIVDVSILMIFVSQIESYVNIVFG